MNVLLFYHMPINLLLKRLTFNKLVGYDIYPCFYDNENVFFTNIHHGETGCYECLERQLISKFPGTVENYFVRMRKIKACTISNYTVIY